MSTNLEQAILKRIQALPDEKQREVLALIDEMLRKEQKTETARPFGRSGKSLPS